MPEKTQTPDPEAVLYREVFKPAFVKAANARLAAAGHPIITNDQEFETALQAANMASVHAKGQSSQQSPFSKFAEAIKQMTPASNNVDPAILVAAAQLK